MRVLTRPAAALALVTASALATLSLPAPPASADPTRDDSWHVKELELAELHRITQGEGVVVAVVDTGVDASHRDLKDNVLPGVDLYDRDGKGDVDRRNHGTGMASLIAGHGHGPGNGNGVLGVAPKAKILPVTVQNEQARAISPEAIATGINWAVDHGADIINVSLGGSFSDELNRAVERAYQQDIIVVAAIGNDDNYVAGFPAQHELAVAVNGTDRKGVISKGAALAADEVDIAAPGEQIVLAVPGDKYETSTGSSSSAALVSGSLALIKARYPDLNAQQLVQRLLETTRDAGDPGHDRQYGWGVLDLRQALIGEPDGRTAPSASASAAPPTANLEAWQTDPGERENGILIAVWAAIIVVFLLLVGGIVALLLRRRARQRQTRPADDTPSLAAAAGSGPGQPADTPDDTVWRRPAT
ncbi:type VII secretion-associated serine protease mycosin [Micromonospora sp. FIMYZ51]|uniref:type VII secretion-associated serine protease mycosin n=1 Tax=Micromonospora sp. FIMYZ51 TaxID=3051832 RepID=UPI0031200374